MSINKLFRNPSSSAAGSCKIQIFLSKGDCLARGPKRLLHHRPSQFGRYRISSNYHVRFPTLHNLHYKSYSTSTLEKGQTHKKETLKNPVDMNRVVLEAREFLDSQGFPTSSPTSTTTLQSLFSNQATVIKSCMTKLIGCPHPIVNLAKDFYREKYYSHSEKQWTSLEMDSIRNDCQNSAIQGPSFSSFFSLSVQLRAIIVLLVTKSIDLPRQSSSTLNPSLIKPHSSEPSSLSKEKHERQRIIEAKQKSLSEITEIMYTAFTIHETVIDIPKLHQIYSHNNSDVKHEEEEELNGERQLSMLHHGNNLAALMGDLLLAKSSRGLASLKNSQVTEFMSESISDFAESQILLMNTLPNPLTLTKNKSNSKKTGISREIWFRKNQLGIGSLLGHACYCSSLFSGHDEAVRHLAYKVGEKLGLLFQASKEISFFLQRQSTDQDSLMTETNRILHGDMEFKLPSTSVPLQFDLCTLPVINALESGTISQKRIDQLRSNFFLGYSQIFNETQAVQRQEGFCRIKEILCSLEDDAVKLVKQLQSPSQGQSTASNNKASKILIDVIRSMNPL